MDCYSHCHKLFPLVRSNTTRMQGGECKLQHMKPSAGVGIISIVFLMVPDTLTLIKGWEVSLHSSWDMSQYLNAKPKCQSNCKEDSFVTPLTLALPHKCLYPPELAVPNCSTEAHQPISFLFLLPVFDCPLLPSPKIIKVRTNLVNSFPRMSLRGGVVIYSNNINLEVR